MELASLQPQPCHALAAATHINMHTIPHIAPNICVTPSVLPESGSLDRMQDDDEPAIAASSPHSLSPPSQHLPNTQSINHSHSIPPTLSYIPCTTPSNAGDRPRLIVKVRRGAGMGSSSSVNPNSSRSTSGCPSPFMSHAASPPLSTPIATGSEPQSPSISSPASATLALPPSIQPCGNGGSGSNETPSILRSTSTPARRSSHNPPSCQPSPSSAHTHGQLNWHEVASKPSLDPHSSLPPTPHSIRPSSLTPSPFMQPMLTSAHVSNQNNSTLSSPTALQHIPSPHGGAASPLSHHPSLGYLSPGVLHLNSQLQHIPPLAQGSFPARSPSHSNDNGANRSRATTHPHSPTQMQMQVSLQRHFQQHQQHQAILQAAMQHAATAGSTGMMQPPQPSYSQSLPPSQSHSPSLNAMALSSLSPSHHAMNSSRPSSVRPSSKQSKRRPLFFTPKGMEPRSIAFKANEENTHKRQQLKSGHDHDGYSSPYSVSHSHPQSDVDIEEDAMMGNGGGSDEPVIEVLGPLGSPSHYHLSPAHSTSSRGSQTRSGNGGVGSRNALTPSFQHQRHHSVGSTGELTSLPPHILAEKDILRPPSPFTPATAQDESLLPTASSTAANPSSRAPRTEYINGVATLVHQSHTPPLIQRSHRASPAPLANNPATELFSPHHAGTYVSVEVEQQLRQSPVPLQQQHHQLQNGVQISTEVQMTSSIMIPEWIQSRLSHQNNSNNDGDVEHMQQPQSISSPTSKKQLAPWVRALDSLTLSMGSVNLQKEVTSRSRRKRRNSRKSKQQAQQRQQQQQQSNQMEDENDPTRGLNVSFRNSTFVTEVPDELDWSHHHDEYSSTHHHGDNDDDDEDGVASDANEADGEHDTSLDEDGVRSSEDVESSLAQHMHDSSDAHSGASDIDKPTVLLTASQHNVSGPPQLISNAYTASLNRWNQELTIKSRRLPSFTSSLKEMDHADLAIPTRRLNSNKPTTEGTHPLFRSGAASTVFVPIDPSFNVNAPTTSFASLSDASGTNSSKLHTSSWARYATTAQMRNSSSAEENSSCSPVVAVDEYEDLTVRRRRPRVGDSQTPPTTTDATHCNSTPASNTSLFGSLSAEAPFTWGGGSFQLAKPLVDWGNSSGCSEEDPAGQQIVGDFPQQSREVSSVYSPCASSGGGSLSEIPKNRASTLPSHIHIPSNSRGNLADFTISRDPTRTQDGKILGVDSDDEDAMNNNHSHTKWKEYGDDVLNMGDQADNDDDVDRATAEKQLSYAVLLSPAQLTSIVSPYLPPVPIQSTLSDELPSTGLFQSFVKYSQATAVANGASPSAVSSSLVSRRHTGTASVSSLMSDSNLSVSSQSISNQSN